MTRPDRPTGPPAGIAPDVNVHAPRAALVVSRRSFVGGAIAAAWGVAVSRLTGPSPAVAQSCAVAGEELLDMLANALQSVNGILQGTVRVTNETRLVTTGAGKCTTPMLRFLEGWNAAGGKIWPPANRQGLPTPGPTLVARVGESVGLALLNNVNASAFFGSLDTGRLPNEALAAGCDTAGNNSPPPPGSPPDSNWLPKNDTYPNCLHGSNACNLHFHGTHVTPEGFGDNVYVMVQADLSVKPADFAAAFKEIFADCSKYVVGPVDWKKAVPQGWQDTQARLLKTYDATTQFRGQRGLPPQLSLFNQNEQALAQGQWPPYQMGAFPNCFTLPEFGNPKTPVKMGQAPGTHWYHAHKHGSTAMHMFHGMAGAFIIRGSYDDDLKTLYPSLREKVIVLQEYAEFPPLYRGTPRAILVNGQFQPKITMRKGEIQLWRIVNATQGTQIALQTSAGCTLQMKQIAQDGVQFHGENYRRQLTGFPFASGNRIDFLVKAPAAACQVQNGNSPLFSVRVEGEGPDMEFPRGQPYPIGFPAFLKDIAPNEIRKTRRITFEWDRGPGRTTGTNVPPHLMIDGHQFDPEHIDQTMDLDTAEEWKIENTTSIAHPFHIHVNPFQIVEIFDPSKNPPLQPQPAPWIWWDTFAIPPNGYFKMWSRFSDFTGKFVFHCHIVGHEDRGMMQAVQVTAKPTLGVPHH
jgi:FtsP/CotA-like multicopper oxidase with cupredoxin domain